jgi:hypothetical protein
MSASDPLLDRHAIEERVTSGASVTGYIAEAS